MKLYSYSSDLLAIVEAKWIKAKCIVGGILMAAIILVGVIILNQSDADPLHDRSANVLMSENNFLRQQVSQISPRVDKLETQAMKLNERADNLHLLFLGRKIIGDTVSRGTNAVIKIKRQSLILAATSNRR